MHQFQHPGRHVARQKSIPRSTFDLWRSTFAEMLRHFLIPLLGLFSLAFMGSCASTTKTTVGVTTNEAPRFHEVGR
jgi:hypothetical protein